MQQYPDELTNLILPHSIENFTCAQCNKVAKNNRRCFGASCSSFYCAACTISWKKCIMCSFPGQPIHDKVIESMCSFAIQNSIAACDICKREVKFLELAEHRKFCSQACENCNHQLDYNNIRTHSSICGNINIKCQYCSVEIKRKEELEHRQQNCPETYLLCNCGTYVKRQELEQHKNTHAINLQRETEHQEKIIAEIEQLESTVAALKNRLPEVRTKIILLETQRTKTPELALDYNNDTAVVISETLLQHNTFSHSSTAVVPSYTSNATTTSFTALPRSSIIPTQPVPFSFRSSSMLQHNPHTTTTNNNLMVLQPNNIIVQHRGLPQFPIIVPPTPSLSFKEAAIVVLKQERGKYLHVGEIMKRIMQQKLLNTVGQTPERTLCAVLHEHNFFVLSATIASTFTLDETLLAKYNSTSRKTNSAPKRKINQITPSTISVQSPSSYIIENTTIIYDDDDDDVVVTPPPSFIDNNGSSEDEEPSKKKKKRDPNCPKRGIQAFFFYGMKRRPELIQQCKGNQGEVSKLLSVEWKKMTDEEKKPFKDMEILDKVRYNNELEKYISNNSAVGKT